MEYNPEKNSNVDEIIDQLDGSARVLVFYSPDEVQSFLRYLFRLKPNLLNSQAGSRFRIVTETKLEKDRTKRRQLVMLLEWLKGVGCRVPLLFYSEGIVEKEIYIELKMKYPSVYACKDQESALNFCRMEEKIDNLLSSFNEVLVNKYKVLEDSVNDISMTNDV